MNDHNLVADNAVLPLYSNLTTTVDLLGSFVEADQNIVPAFIRNQAFMRRLNLSFIALFEYLREASQMPQDYFDKPPEELATYFISKGLFTDEDKESFVSLAGIYVAIRWSSAGKSPDEEKIMTKVPAMYVFLKKIVANGSSAR